MTMKLHKLLPALILLVAVSTAQSQIFYNNGALVHATTGAIVQINGDASNNGATASLTNQGDVTITGDLTNNATLAGDGDFHVAGDWINNSTFNSGTGSVELNGPAQMITGTQVSDFYDLLLTGTGIKTMGINARVGNILALNDRELATQAFTMFVDNNASTAITRTSGFVSSLAGGTLSRATASAAAYEFPVGSSIGTLRYRPVNITPGSSAANVYTVRLANNAATTDGYSLTSIDTTICQANPNFYHMINRSSGSSAADISINFAAADGNWEGIANWIPTPGQWQTVGTTTVASNYVTRAAWNTFVNEPYVLTTHKANAEIAAVPELCANGAVYTLTAAETGGTWAGTGISGASTGEFTPSLAGEGTHIVSYTISGSCGDVDSTTIVINPVASLSAVTTDESCQGMGDGSIDLSVSGGSSPYTYSWDNSASTEDISGLAPGSYLVNVTDNKNCTVSQTYNILAATEACVPESFYIPNIFSPNGDQINDVFYVRATGVKTLHLVIYDRWGEKIFETEDVNKGWDGTFRDKEMESAVFVYQVKAEMNSGTVYDQKGNITLVR
jgi:gliding motility-associated-like protein